MADVHLPSTVQYDMTWAVVSLLKKLGLASNVKLPYVANLASAAGAYCCLCSVCSDIGCRQALPQSLSLSPF